MSFNPLIAPLCLASALMAVTPQVAAANRLKDEQSPYLLQHAGNPVDWYPWSDEAFATATRQQQLIFLSIGYSTCHWCHVMEQESFEDEEVARLLNRDFISIKVDREERPDIDQFYMQVATRLTGQGGWPLNIIMTPDKIPLFAATYIPKERKFNRPGMLDLLPQIAAAWADHPKELERDARKFLQSLEPVASSQTFSFETISQARQQMEAEFDTDHGGFGTAPKFPRPHQLAFLLQQYQIDAAPQTLEMVTTTLSAMRNGGIYDQLGFGFHRYSTDRNWLVPHFEKMLYDQAGLAEIYLQTYRLTGRKDFAETASEIFDYLLRAMRDPAGGFYSAEDADTLGVEGQTYLWQKSEFLEILGPDRGARLARYYNLKDSGNFHAETGEETGNANIPHRSRTLEFWAKEFDMTVSELSDDLEDARQLLMQKRNQRPQPFRDDKVLTSWNAMVISVLSHGALILHDEKLHQAAIRAVDFLLNELVSPKGQLLRRWRKGQAAINAFAEDYAYLSRALLDLYQLELDPQRLQQAQEFAETLFSEFAANGTIYTSADNKELPQRTSERYDGAMPSTPSIALEVAARLAQLTGETVWKKRAEILLFGASQEVKRYPQGFPHLLMAAERLGEQARELVIIGPPDDEKTQTLIALSRTSSNPVTSLLFIDPAARKGTDEIAPFSRDMRMVDEKPTAYLCSGQSCGAPLTSASALEEKLSTKRGS